MGLEDLGGGAQVKSRKALRAIGNRGFGRLGSRTERGSYGTLGSDLEGCFHLAVIRIDNVQAGSSCSDVARHPDVDDNLCPRRRSDTQNPDARIGKAYFRSRREVSA